MTEAIAERVGDDAAFGVIDEREEDEAVGLELRDTTLVIFGGL